MRKFFYILYLKWIKKACPHICRKCEHYNWCHENGIDWFITDLETQVQVMKNLK